MMFSFEPAVCSLSCVLQLLLMTDVTDMLTAPAVRPTRMGASGVTTRNASQPVATAARFVCKGEWWRHGHAPCMALMVQLLCSRVTSQACSSHCPYGPITALKGWHQGHAARIAHMVQLLCSKGDVMGMLLVCLLIVQLLCAKGRLFTDTQNMCWDLADYGGTCL